jgi:hypothetical protein
MDNNTRRVVLFVNGVNTNFGGASVRLNKIWRSSMWDAGCDPHVLDSVPTFGIEKNDFFLKALLALYFLPGTLFRFSRFPGLEILVKLSPILLVRFLWQCFVRRPSLVLLSHHSMFLYGMLLRRRRRVFVVHDLLYIRACSMNYPRFLCKSLFRIECALYGVAAQVLVLSESERRLLDRFLRVPVVLISCLRSEQRSTPVKEAPPRRIALVSDWRRPENLHGLVTFFEKSHSCPRAVGSCVFAIYGLGSESATQALAGLPAGFRFTFVDSGSYRDISEIQENFFLVPTYHGAGIKTKVLEAFDAGRFVVGTRAAFIGLKRASLKDISLIVNTPEEIEFPEVAGTEIREVFHRYYFVHFSDIGSVIRNIPIN